MDLSHLNQQQQRAVEHAAGPAVVLAGAGSGKTTVLTHRVAKIIEDNNATPDQILVVTFTNKAASEMKERIYSLTGEQLLLAGTFHSISARMLRKYGQYVGLDPNFVIYDTNDQQSLMKALYKKYGVDKKRFNINATRSAISSAKNELFSASEYAQATYNDFQSHVALMYRRYQDTLRQVRAVDFDDLLFYFVKLLNTNQTVRTHLQERITHVLVDEYQDTNTAQYTLTKLLAAPHNNLFAVGDFSQSIYAWRGADYRNMLRLSKDFSTLKQYELDQNYRSTQTILDAATAIISKNTLHPILSLWTENSAQEPISLITTETGEDEARAVIQNIRMLKAEHQLSDIAILYRTNAQSRLFEEALIFAHLPYTLYGGTKFYERKEIKDLLAYLRLLANPLDVLSLERTQKIGKRRYNAFLAWTESEDTQVLQPTKALKKIIEVTKYLDFFDEKDPEDISRMENIAELTRVTSQFTTISQLLENVALIQDNAFIDGSEQTKEKNSGVKLMSLHSAKGLEFPVVFMVGMEDGLLPHSRSLTDREQMEEERRLCYVGITRAKEKLLFTHAKRRFYYGSSSYNTRSRFISDIPPALIEGLEDQHGQDDVILPKRRFIPDEDLEGVLSGEMDLETFIRS